MKRLLTLCLIALTATGLAARNNTYFVSSDGNDSADGLSIATAWKSLDKINSMTFLPGDRILLKAGDEFKGQLTLKGSGEENAPIVLSSFGNGRLRPVINFGEAEGAGILIHNESHWEVSNVEITSFAAPQLGVHRQGIVITADAEGAEFNHIVVKNCYIHDIWGQLGGDSAREPKYSCGIYVSTPRRFRDSENGTAPCFNDLLIEGNRIERMDKCGIRVIGGRNDVVVRGNYMDNLGGDGIIVGGTYRGLIEYNEIHRSCIRSGYPDLPGGKDWWPHTAACWIHDAVETVMQFNEVYDTGREPYNGDGEAYDFDFNCVRCVAQYNYSKNNHGLILLMYDITDNIVRYNISENDRTHLIQIQGSLVDDRTLIYNNVFYVDYGTLDIDLFRGDDRENPKDLNMLGANFHNNIFYATGQGRFRTVYSTGGTFGRDYDEVSKPDLPAGSIFLHNCYYGPWKNGIPDDPEALVADPMFVFPGTGGTGLDTLCGYALKPESPCINGGMAIPDAGERDFFGNPLEDGHPDFGVFEAVGSGAYPD